MINVDVSVKNIMYVKDYKIINDDSVITCDEIIDTEGRSNDEETKTVPTNFNEKYVTFKSQNFYILLAFFKITIASLIAVSI